MSIPEASDSVERWRHLKTGGTYTIVMDCRIEATNTPAIAYRSEETGIVWVRPKDEFLDGRFERVVGKTAGEKDGVE